MKKSLPFEYRITLLYMLFGALWILFSDELVVNLTSDPRTIQKLSTFKGWFYVLITGLLLYSLIKKEIKRRNALYQQLVEANKKAVEADNLKTAFLMNLNHYIRTPMNSILGFVGLLENKNLNEEKQQLFLTYINDRSHKLLNTLNNIIELAQLQEGQLKQNKTRFSINSMLRQIIDVANGEIERLNKPIFIKHHFALTNDIDELEADRGKLIQIIEDLARNAVYFTNAGEIKIGYTINPESVVFYITDTGVGIPLEKQQTLFAQFMSNPYQVISETEGVGLGLYLANQFTYLLGGKLWLVKSDENGSEFRLQIPR